MKRLTAVSACMSLSLLAACGAPAGGDDVRASGDGVLKFGAVLAHTTLDPDLLTIPQLSVYAAPLYDSLTFLNPDESVEPMLATKWEAGEDDEGPYLDMALREGLTFPDGTPFTAATVAANVERSQSLERSANAAALAGVTVEELSPTEVRLRSDAGVGALPRRLAGPAGMMISDEAIANEMDLTSESAGIGAYTIQTLQPNRAVYQATEDYWDEDAIGSDTLELQYLADDAKLNAVRAGDLDITTLPQQMVQTAENSGYDIQRSLGAENYVFSFNTEMEPFDDVRVRKAVNLALDREAICQGLLAGACEPSRQFFGAGNSAHNPDPAEGRLSFDLDKAKELVEEAGAAGTDVEIVTVAGKQEFEQLAATLQEQLDKIGLDASVSPVAPPQVVSRFTSEQDVALAFGATGNSFDPSDTVKRYVLKSGLYNPGGLENEEVEKLAQDALRETDQDKRLEIYRELSDTVMDKAPFATVLTPETAYVIAPGVEGWQGTWAPAFPTFRGVSG